MRLSWAVTGLIAGGLLATAVGGAAADRAYRDGYARGSGDRFYRPVSSDRDYRYDGRGRRADLYDALEDRHERHHEGLDRLHDRQHDRLEEAHERWHDRHPYYSERAHEREHDRLVRAHERGHEALERRHEREHERLERIRERWDNRD
jgi:hypothetical protein